MLRKYLKYLGEFTRTLLYGAVEEERPTVVFPLPWVADDRFIRDANGEMILEICNGTGTAHINREVCLAIVNSVNQTGWWDYRVFNFPERISL